MYLYLWWCKLLALAFPLTIFYNMDVFGWNILETFHTAIGSNKIHGIYYFVGPSLYFLNGAEYMYYELFWCKLLPCLAISIIIQSEWLLDHLQSSFGPK